MRSTKAGAGTPATPPSPGSADPPSRALNEGRSRNSGDTPHVLCHGPLDAHRSTKAGAGTPATPPADTAALDGLIIAQRRPEPELRRHAPRGRRGSARRSPLNEGRSRNSGDTHREADGDQRGDLRSTKAGAGTPATPGPPPSDDGCMGRRSTKAGAGTPATRTSRGRSRDRSSPLNEGRSRNSGDTIVCPASSYTSGGAQRRPEPELRRHRHATLVQEEALLRSTKAGAGTPATPLIVMIQVEPVKLRVSQRFSHRFGGRIAQLWCLSQDERGDSTFLFHEVRPDEPMYRGINGGSQTRLHDPRLAQSMLFAPAQV